MTDEKEPQTKEERLKQERMEKKARLGKLLSEHPNITPPTGKKGPRVFNPIKIRGEPLSETIIKARRC